MKNHPPNSAYRWYREYLAITSLQSYLSTLMPCSEVAGNAQNVSGKGIRREVREKGKLARQALKAADTKPFLYKSSAQFWPESLAATKQHSGTQRKRVACKEQIQLVAALEHPLPFGGYLGSLHGAIWRLSSAPSGKVSLRFNHWTWNRGTLPWDSPTSPRACTKAALCPCAALASVLLGKPFRA